MKDYVLEVETSQRRCSDVILQDGPQKVLQELKGPRDRFIKFTIYPRINRNLMTLNTLWRVTIGAVFTVLVYHVLLRVDPIGELLALPATQVKTETDFLRSVVGSIRGTMSSPNLVQLIYLAVSAWVTEWLCDQVDSSIEETFRVIPELGIQTETILIRRSLTKLYLRIVLAAVRTVVDRLFRRASEPQSQESEMRDKERRELASSCSTLGSLDKALARGDRVVLCREFVAMEYVRDVTINEGFIGFQVIFYLAAVVSDSPDGKVRLLMLFPKLLPRRRLLEAVWRRSRRYLE